MKEIQLTHGKFALVDDADYISLSKFKWYVRKRKTTMYAERSIYSPESRSSIYMHQQIMGAKDGMINDHRGGNGLNNQRDNLRFSIYYSLN